MIHIPSGSVYKPAPVRVSDRKILGMGCSLKPEIKILILICKVFYLIFFSEKFMFEKYFSKVYNNRFFEN